MYQKIKSWILKTKNNNKKEICQNCIWWKSEESCNVPFKKNRRYCYMKSNYKYSHNTCTEFKEELFEATENSISTPEMDLNLQTEWSAKNNE